MIHLFFNKPWDRLLKKKSPLCKIFNPVMKVTGLIKPSPITGEKDSVCDGCYEVYRSGMTIWTEPIKKEKKKNV